MPRAEALALIQRYILPAGGVFAIRDGRIVRITALRDWVARVSA
jgi:hypothetical protein